MDALQRLFVALKREETDLSIVQTRYLSVRRQQRTTWEPDHGMSRSLDERVTTDQCSQLHQSTRRHDQRNPMKDKLVSQLFAEEKRVNPESKGSVSVSLTENVLSVRHLASWKFGAKIEIDRKSRDTPQSRADLLHGPISLALSPSICASLLSLRTAWSSRSSGSFGNPSL